MIYDDGDEEVYFRFNFPFLQETLIGMQLFESMRKPIMLKVIDYLQDNVIFDWTTDWNFNKEVTLLIQILITLENVNSEHELSEKSKQAIVIKRVN